ncbi:hypothetical protein CTAYLR_008893 [Chrysophaeum taylorii]|uniref:Aromatic amino acid beta-eliminating lyase/threonine aldolase domain-containing protein n=1 Tax=Chrysophaeum taylorii TaxID=2483200 RepID=A0AAD7XMY0_9STRA|nr:hypothetical protein CTAYLR_008893 [Chrysophaeum taylorii]
MREAMARAEVGDDVLGSDPTVRVLEERVAAICGKEAGVFVPSGTQGNLISLMAHCWERGSEYIVGDAAHMYVYEQGGGATIGAAHPRVVQTAKTGELPIDAVRSAVRGNDQHFPVTRLVAIENTHNMFGGLPLSSDYASDLGDLCQELGLKLHIDGARIWHAAAALDVPISDLCAPADSVSLCLSKALGAPAGSVVVGDAAFVAKARRLRKVLGGAMRQTGVLAAAGLVAMDDHLPNLHRDHLRIRTLARGLEALGCKVDPAPTNVLFMETTPSNADALVAHCRDHFDVHFLHVGAGRVRFVAHHQVDDLAVDKTLAAIEHAIAHPLSS